MRSKKPAVALRGPPSEWAMSQQVRFHATMNR